MALALVTGASGGIGVEFCKILAQKKYDLILVSSPRSEKFMRDEQAPALEKTYHIKCYVIPCNLDKTEEVRQLFEKIKSQNLQVNFLINNAGLLFNGFFHKLELDKQLALLNVNINALTTLCHLFINDMAGRGGGYILNVASTAAWMGIPNENIYAASKAYVLSFSLALADEMAASKTNVKVSALCPHYTATKMLDNPEQGQKLTKFTGKVLSPDFVAKQGIEGCLKAKPVIVPGLSHKINTYLYQLLPKMLITRIAGKTYRKNLI